MPLKDASEKAASRYPTCPSLTRISNVSRGSERLPMEERKRNRKCLFMQESAIIAFPTFTLLPEFAWKVRNTIERFLLSLGASLDSFAFAVTVVAILLIIMVHRAFSVIVGLISISVAVALHWRSGLRLLELSEDGAEVYVGSRLWWLIVRCSALAYCCHCCVEVKARSSGLWHGLRLHLRLHLSGLLLGIGELGKDRFQSVRSRLNRLLLLYLRLWGSILLRLKKVE